MRIDDLAKLVRLAPIKHINPSRLRGLFVDCSTPEESSKWIESIAAETPPKPPYKEILEEVWEQQQLDPGALVEYAALRVGLLKRGKPVKKLWGRTSLFWKLEAFRCFATLYQHCKKRLI